MAMCFSVLKTVDSYSNFTDSVMLADQTFDSQAILLSSYLCRIKRKENSSCRACGDPLQDRTHLLLDCPAPELLRRAIFGTTSIFDL